jgi:cardiolipin synthase
LTLKEMAGATRSELNIPFLAAGSYPVRAGNLLRPLVDGLPAFRRICEAVEAARHSVWVTVTFIAPDFPMLDGCGSVFDLLDRAVERGLDVRVIFRRPNSVGIVPIEPIVSTKRAGSWTRVRRPRPHSSAGSIRPSSLSARPVTRARANSDVYVEVAGPSATDVHHNFVQR